MIKFLYLLFDKTGYIFGFSIVLSSITILWSWFIDNLIVSTNFVGVLICLLIIDLIVGMAKHLKLNDFDFKEMSKGFLTKVMISFLGMSTFNLLSTLDDLKIYSIGTDYILLLGKLMLFIYVGGSALQSMYIVTDEKFPPKIFMKRFKKFSETLDPTHLKK